MPDNPAVPALDPEAVANRQKLMDRLTAARQQGASWDQIHQSLNGRVQAARAAGATDAQIQHSLGFSSPDELIAATRSDAQEHLNATKPMSWTEAFVSGLTHSSTAALLGTKPAAAPQGRVGQVIASLGEAVGDLPASLAGGVLGTIGGGVAGAAVPGAGETGTSEALGGALGGAVGANALPQLIKSERDRYVQALARGQVKSPGDFLAIQGQVLADTAKAGAVGAVTAGAGRYAGGVLDKMGAGKATKLLGTVGTEAGTMATAQAALAGRMPTMEDFVDASVTVGAFHVGGRIAGKITGKPTQAIRTRLMQNYVETGQHPADAANQAIADPPFRAKLLGIPDPIVPPGSSRTDVSPLHVPSPGEMSGPHTPLPSDRYIIPRVTGDFDHALAWMFKEEGGMTTDTGGLTKYGISAKAHPGLDIAHLSRDDAAEIYHKEYWRAIDGDSLPPNMRLAAFDSAVNQGVQQTKLWLKEAKGDLQEFMRLRVEKYAELARDPKYAKYAKSWARRLKDLGASDAMASVVHNGPNNFGQKLSEGLREELDMDGGEGGGGPPKGPGTGGEHPEDEDPWKSVMGRVAPMEEQDRWGDTINGFRRIYGELFDPMHPIRNLVDDAIVKGGPLDDYRNPNLLFRVAENSGEVAKTAISKNMVDLNGNVTGPGLQDIVSGKSAGAKFSLADEKRFLNGYAVAKWALMMDAQGKETGVDIDHAKAVVEQGKDQFDTSFQHLVDWRNGTLKWLGEGGVHEQGKIDKLIAENESAIPGYRRMDDGSWRPVSTGKPGIWNPIKSAEGSERQIEPILKSLMQDAFLRHELASNNRSVASLADLGMAGNKAVQRRLVDVNLVTAMDALKDKGIDDDMMSSLAKSAGAPLAKDEVPVLRDGKMYGVKFEDPEITRVLRGYDQTARSTLMKVVATITAPTRNLQTRYNPLFPVHLLAYDLPWQYITNPDSKGPFSSFFVGLGHMVGNSEMYQQWLQSGGADHVFDGLSKSDYMKRVLQGHEEVSLGANIWNVVKSPFDGLTAWTRMVSTPIKLGRYARGIEKGETPLRAAAASSEAAFHRPAFGGPVGKAWNMIVPYTTAHLNGLEKAVRAQLGLGSTVTGVKYNALNTTIKGAALVTMPFIAQWFAYKDEDWYKAMPDWQKDTAWFIVPPTGGTPPIAVAAPPILSALYVTLPRRLLEAFVADNPHAADGIAGALGESLMPPGMLTGASIMSPILEHVTNHSFHRDRPLVTDSTINAVQPAEQFSQYSTQGAKDLAQFASDLPLIHSNVAIAPSVIDNYIGHWGGPMGRAAVAAADAAIARPPDTPRPEMKVSEWPGISSWVVRYPSASAEPISQFYNTVTELNKEHGSLVKEIREGNFDAFKRIVDQGGPSAAAYHQMNLGDNVPQGVDLQPYMDYLARASQKADYQNMSLVKQAADALKSAHDYSQSVNENRNLTGHDKRQILDSMNAQMQKISERGNEAADRALIGASRAGASARKPIPDSISFVPPQ